MEKIFALLARKRDGIKLIVLGVFLGFFVLFFLYLNVMRVPGFPEFLPARDTIGYVKFPAKFGNAFGETLLARINKDFELNWSTDIEPWAGDDAALAFLTSGADNKNLIPVALFQLRSAEQAFAFLKNYKNPEGGIEELLIHGITAYKTPAVYFAFVSDVLIVAHSESDLSAILSYQSSLSRHLGGDADFIKVNQNVGSDVFAFLRPDKFPRAVYESMAMRVPRMPFLELASPAIGISAEKSAEGSATGGKFWQGKFHTTLENPVPMGTEQAYKALLLKFLPANFHLLLAGQNLPAQMKKIEGTASLANLFMDGYFPEVDFGEILAPLLQGEFAATVSSETDGDKILFITEITNQTITEHIEILRAAFSKKTGDLALVARAVTLPDGTEAEELLPARQNVRTFNEDFNGITINGFNFGGKGGLYDAATQGKWFVSNDLAALKKSLALTREPGEQFHDSKLYRQSLQPILKNPELLGIAELREGTFGFSKRTFADHMETSFTFMLK